MRLRLGAAMMLLVVVLIGVYALTAFIVESRTREIAVRMALGATTGRVQRLMVNSSVRSVVIGVFLGLGASRLIENFGRSAVFGLLPLNFLTYALTGGAVVVAASLAAAVPAQRAANLDPATTLRHD